MADLLQARQALQKNQVSCTCPIDAMNLHVVYKGWEVSLSVFYGPAITTTVTAAATAATAAPVGQGHTAAAAGILSAATRAECLVHAGHRPSTQGLLCFMHAAVCCYVLCLHQPVSASNS